MLKVAVLATWRGRLVAAALAAVIAGGTAVLVVTQTRGHGQTRTSIRLLTQPGLKSAAKGLGHPIYWAGPALGYDYELTLVPDGRVVIRYVPAGAKPRTGPRYLSVGTYPFPKAFAATGRLARQRRFVRVKAGRGVVAVFARSRPTNIFVAFRGVNYQTEVFDPHPGQALKIVLGRHVVPVQ